MFSPIDTRSLFRLYGFYTTVLAIIMLTMYLANTPLSAWQAEFPRLLPLVLSAYCALAGLNIVTAYATPASSSDKLTPYFLAEIIIISCLMLFVAPAQQELGMVLLISVALANLTLSARMGYLIAAMATITVLTHSFINNQAHSFLVENSLLATLFFFEAWLFNLFKSRLYIAEINVHEKQTALKKASRMNNLIIDRMQTGICVITSSMQIISTNRSAQERLGDIPANGLHDAIYERLVQWREFGKQNETPVLIPETKQRLLLSFATIDEHTYVIFIDDLRIVTQKAQQLKLSSLGRMAASIAHEIRNPLSAISHAAQLLEESNHLDEDDRRLCEIIGSHSTRVDMIIQNVLQISRRKHSQPKELSLLPWLANFKEDFLHHHNVRFQLPEAPNLQSLKIAFDPSQLHQVLWNLCENVLNHGSQHQCSPVIFHIGFKQDGRTYLSVRDKGPGIPKAQQDFLFEPFHTTSAKGTGLGLFIVKELCEANHSEIRYDNQYLDGAGFEILFAHNAKAAVNPTGSKAS